ncbi:hypothetical protein PX554_15785 [Sphingomonas sp. H39-1-10]|uniref:hypothetical protein n=1 Tax=Sphingomonas TaxID=13687 RepID=UPI000884D305|nr:MULTISPECIES: hypothetical protein [Sphingomonas]MDF0489595.1 hypothetical protein [Sphingomonas pollutisoli]SDA28336.1 hypothetical protein SAMN03159340_02191 [Sphingomonas sp. NFR15]
MNDATSIEALFVESFNRDLAALDCPARVSTPLGDNPDRVLELHDPEGRFLCFVPESSSPEMVKIAYRLYLQGLHIGEQLAWAKLQRMVGTTFDLAN